MSCLCWYVFTCQAQESVWGAQMESSGRQANQTPRLSPLTPRCTRAKEKQACGPRLFLYLRFLGSGQVMPSLKPCPGKSFLLRPTPWSYSSFSSCSGWHSTSHGAWKRGFQKGKANLRACVRGEDCVFLRCLRRVEGAGWM
jgi:hypothetical protein